MTIKLHLFPDDSHWVAEVFADNHPQRSIVIETVFTDKMDYEEVKQNMLGCNHEARVIRGA